MRDLSQKSVLITGASRGIGAETARAFAAAGARVALLARSREAIADLAGEIGDQALAIPCDVSRYWEVAAAVDATVDAFGGLDIVVNNAGVIDPIAPLVTSDPADWAKVMEINVNGVYHGMRAAMPVMLEAGGGTILTVSSGAATHALEGWSHYCASKAAVAMLTRCADLEGRSGGLRAIGLSPGTVATDMQVQIKASGLNPVSRLTASDHIPPDWPAKALVWLATAEADDLIGTEVSLRDPAIRRRIGLIP
ncbi:SDR family oxidoreductase [Pseudoruegeria sp. SK021]|uniref:SDR family oxidoreductase n=1 Tax=Pseudoruegeria sp. SK021 TaxID=1933035 RepID=UPI000A23C82F|nr:SDR family oxidoreductase [Pseudoruegeria sp. SK021]OSP55066.1 short-chain dehydrogenase [Pseudoruegeria sp. SK021]